MTVTDFAPASLVDRLTAATIDGVAQWRDLPDGDAFEVSLDEMVLIVASLSGADGVYYLALISEGDAEPWLPKSREQQVALEELFILGQQRVTAKVTDRIMARLQPPVIASQTTVYPPTVSVSPSKSE